jgi:hypothetical protein
MMLRNIRNCIFRLWFNLILLTIGFGLVSCSTKSIYENLQDNSRSMCKKEQSSAYDDCIDQHKKSYETYTQEREILLKKNK